MGACATKPGDLKVKGEAPLVVEDAVAAAAEKAKADGIPDAEASDGKAGHQEAEKVVVGEPASAVGETMGPPQAPVQASVAAEQDDTAEEPEDGLPSGDAHAAEEEKRVDPESVQAAVAADAPKSSEESEAANDDDDASA
uniref:Uncharacterized protein n=1 Tax=Zea mays TaxID=4577 RepID=A0A804NS06_MAIZE